MSALPCLCASLRLFVEAIALKKLNPASRQAILCCDSRRRQIALNFPTVSIHRMVVIARRRAAARIEKGHGCTIRRAKRDAQERKTNAALQQMRLALARLPGQAA
jgi:hypothetical protein